MEKFDGLDVINKKVILGYTVRIVELNKKHIGKKKPPLYGLDNGPGLYWNIWSITLNNTTDLYFGPFKNSTDAFNDAELYIEKKAGES